MSKKFQKRGNKCPVCHGEGEALAFSIVVEMRLCAFCNGTGSVTDADLSRIARGAELKNERVSKGERLIDAARRQGISTVELSRIENGY